MLITFLNEFLSFDMRKKVIAQKSNAIKKKLLKFNFNQPITYITSQ